MAGLNPLYPAPDKWRPGDNLLDNWYFVGGGSQLGWGHFPINQWGQTSTQTAGYFIDRWRYGSAQSEGSATLTDEGIELAHPGNDTGRTELAQVIANPPTGTVTASLLTSNNQLLTGTGTMGNLAVLVAGKHVINVTSTTFQIRAWYGVRFTVVAAMLEPGPEQHLAHRENGAWVLNRVPDYREELMKCQVYYNDLGILDISGFVWGDRYFYGTIPLDTKMRILPALKCTSVGNLVVNGGALPITNIFSDNMKGNGVRIRAEGDFGSAVGYTATIVNCILSLDANP